MPTGPPARSRIAGQRRRAPRPDATEAQAPTARALRAQACGAPASAAPPRPPRRMLWGPERGWPRAPHRRCMRRPPRAAQVESGRESPRPHGRPPRAPPAGGPCDEPPGPPGTGARSPPACQQRASRDAQSSPCRDSREPSLRLERSPLPRSASQALGSLETKRASARGNRPARAARPATPAGPRTPCGRRAERIEPFEPHPRRRRSRHPGAYGSAWGHVGRRSPAATTTRGPRPIRIRACVDARPSWGRPRAMFRQDDRAVWAPMLASSDGALVSPSGRRRLRSSERRPEFGLAPRRRLPCPRWRALPEM